MKLRRATWLANVVVVGTTLPALLLPVATPNSPSSLPLYEFVNSGTGPLPWNAHSFENSINNTTMLGNPHAVSQDGEAALVYRMANSQIGLYVANANGTTSWSNVSTLVATPSALSDPVPFFDPQNNLDILYVSTSNHLILLSTNTARAPIADHVAHPTPWSSFTSTDLTLETGVGVAAGLASVHVNGTNGFIAVRTLTNNAEVIPLSWGPARNVPVLAGPALNISNTTGAGTISNNPVVLPENQNSFVATTGTGALTLFVNQGPTMASWTTQNLSALTATAKLTGALAVTSTALTTYVAGLTANGNVELFQTPATTFAAPIGSSSAWTASNVTSAAIGAPALAGSIFMYASPTQLSIAGQAANWGDLFVLTNQAATVAWTATDVSVTAGSAARTVGPGITGMQLGSGFDLFAAGINSPPPQGVGLYAIPNKDWGLAIKNGWPIISGTGGLGTQSAPWVGFTSATSVAYSPDFLLGQSIYNSHKRVTWLSFWTVSGPMASETRNPSTYYNHGFAAGAWVATQIDQYRNLGVGLKPDWVIFDPEGYPDNHSGLDAPGGSSKAVMAQYATYWAAMLNGWTKGIASVDPSLKSGVYASQSEYRNYGLVNMNLPVFMAVAFAQGGPIQIAGASGSNIRGYIAFDATCTPTSTLKAQEATLLNPPWSGQFNTLQFNAGVYCPPA
ncbi:MAG: hypothetical protein ACYC1I_02170 [Acidimicrobiales bacterium]